MYCGLSDSLWDTLSVCNKWTGYRRGAGVNEGETVKQILETMLADKEMWIKKHNFIRTSRNTGAFAGRSPALPGT